MLGWALLVVLVLLVGAAAVGVLARRLGAEVDALGSTVTAVGSLGASSDELRDEIQVTTARRAARGSGGTPTMR